MRQRRVCVVEVRICLTLENQPIVAGENLAAKTLARPSRAAIRSTVSAQGAAPAADQKG
jgi:hypothetical protein